jgi:hypothetical protein
MKFMLLLVDDESFHTLPEADQMKIVGEHIAYSAALREAGAFVYGEPLDSAASARTVTATRVQDGPYASAKEQLGGFYVIEAADMDAAIAWARKSPTIKNGKVEVRPIPTYG